MNCLFQSRYSPPVRAAHLYQVCEGLRKHNIPNILIRQICLGYLYTASEYAVDFLRKIEIFERDKPWDCSVGLFWSSDHAEHRPYVGAVGRIDVGSHGSPFMMFPTPGANPLAGVALFGQFLNVDDFTSHEIKVISLAIQKFPWAAEDPAHFFFTGPSHMDHIGNNHLRFIASYFAGRTGSSGAALDHFDSTMDSLPFFEIILLGVLAVDGVNEAFDYYWFGRTTNILLLWSILKKLKDLKLMIRFKRRLQAALEATFISADSILVKRMLYVLDSLDLQDSAVPPGTLFEMIETMDVAFQRKDEDEIAKRQRLF